jgi:serine/threonine-protein kinase
MSQATLSRPTADRNLLFGLLAVQLDFLAPEAFCRGLNDWVRDKARPLGEILVEQGALGGDAHQLLEALVCKHLELHGGDPQKSLATIGSLNSVRRALQQIPEPDLLAGLTFVSVVRPEAKDYSPIQTEPAAPAPVPGADTVGTPTSAGVRFRILRPHAQGGLGQVLVALDEELHREVALKEIKDRHANHAESRDRFVREAEITGGLEHPGIVPVYGLGHYPDGRPFYAMRFIQGESLQEAIRRFHAADRPDRDGTERALELRQLLGRFVDVCHAIAYAHSRGVIHRDLKPANVMLGQFGETLVVDWGLAKATGRPVGDGEPAAQPRGSPAPAPLQPPSTVRTAVTQVGSSLVRLCHLGHPLGLRGI